MGTGTGAGAGAVAVADARTGARTGGRDETRTGAGAGTTVRMEGEPTDRAGTDTLRTVVKGFTVKGFTIVETTGDGAKRILGAGSMVPTRCCIRDLFEGPRTGSSTEGLSLELLARRRTASVP